MNALGRVRDAIFSRVMAFICPTSKRKVTVVLRERGKEDLALIRDSLRGLKEESFTYKREVRGLE